MLFKKDEPIFFTNDQKAINRNIKAIDKKLLQRPSTLSNELRIKLNNINVNNLTWEDSIANQIISDDSTIVETLSHDQYIKFMEPANKMLSNLPEVIQNQCHEFVTNYRKKQKEQSTLSRELTHDKQWKEKEKKLKKITKSIFDVL